MYFSDNLCEVDIETFVKRRQAKEKRGGVKRLHTPSPLNNHDIKIAEQHILSKKSCGVSCKSDNEKVIHDDEIKFSSSLSKTENKIATALHIEEKKKVGETSKEVQQSSSDESSDGDWRVKRRNQKVYHPKNTGTRLSEDDDNRNKLLSRRKSKVYDSSSDEDVNRPQPPPTWPMNWPAYPSYPYQEGSCGGGWQWPVMTPSMFQMPQMGSMMRPPVPFAPPFAFYPPQEQAAQKSVKVEQRHKEQQSKSGRCKYL